MLNRFVVALLVPFALAGASEWVLVRTVDGTVVEGRTAIRSVRIESGTGKLESRLAGILSIHNAAPASASEQERITAALAAVQGSDRKARDRAVEELTAIGLPVLTPLLQTLKDTDQHEPRPLYRLFERIMPSRADGFDRTLSLVRLRNGGSLRGKLPDADLEVQTADGGKQALPWSKIRSLAVRQKLVQRSMRVHSIVHSTQIEYLDTGVELTAASKVDSSTAGFVRLSWNADGWASDPDGLKKPGAPSYKTNLFDGHPFGALVGRVSAGGQPFFLGRKATKTGLPAGRLGLAINDNRHWQNNLGAYSVTMTATEAYDLGDAQ